MLFIFPEGRFGNQVFQYQFAKSIVGKGEKIRTVKMQCFDILDLEDDNVNFVLLNVGKTLNKYLNFLLDKIFNILVKLKLITGVYQIYDYYGSYFHEINCYEEKKGLFGRIKYVKGFFIYDGNHLDRKITIKTHFMVEAQKILGTFPVSNKIIFVHIRRGDYVSWKVLGEEDLSLPGDYFLNQMQFFIDQYQGVSFVVLSDDIGWCKSQFKDIDNIYFSENMLGVDFALMTLCDGAIISASTLSYLGAYYMIGKLEKFCPNYFLGFKKQVRYPHGIESDKFDYIGIE